MRRQMPPACGSLKGLAPAAHLHRAGAPLQHTMLLPPSLPSPGDEVFLFNEGYMAPGMFEVFIQSAPSTNDGDGQARLPGLSGPHTAQDVPLQLGGLQFA